MGITHTLVPRGQNRGLNSSPGTPEYHYKKGERIAKKGREIWDGSIINKILSRRKLREISKLSPGILETATIAHTRIQKESNFASLRGLNNHLRL